MPCACLKEENMSSSTWMAIGMVAGAVVGIPLGTQGMIVTIVAGAVIGYFIGQARGKGRGG